MHSFNFVAQNTNQGNTSQSPQNASPQEIPGGSAQSGPAVNPAPADSSPASPKLGGHRSIIIGVVALVIIAVIASFAYSRLSVSQPISASSASSTSSSAASTATGYAKIATSLSAGKTVTLSQLASVAGFNITQGISKLISGSSNKNDIFGNETNVSYSVSGKVSASVSGIILSFPFSYLIGSDTNGNYSVINAKGKILSSNLSYIIVNTPTSYFICNNQNQSQNLLISLFDSSVSGNNQPPPPDNKCVAKEMPKKETNQTIIASYAAIANNIANNVSLNASNVSYVSYRGNSCIYLKGYITSNKIKISQVPSASNTNNSQSYFVKFSGPYSTCISTATGLPYNFTTTMALNLTSPPSTSTTSTTSSFSISSLNVSFSVASNMTYYGKAESTQELSALPYPIINGTCPSGMTIDTINGTSQYFMCQNVNMNSSGYVMMELSPSKNPTIFGIQPSNQTEKIRILGLYCEETNSSSASIFMPEPNATLFTPVNISSMSNQSLSITTRCSSTSLGTQYNGTIYAVAVTKSVFKPNTTVNTSLSIGTFSVLPTITGAVGSNPNNGPVSKNVIVTNPFSSGPTIISTNSTPAYNSVG